MFHAASAGRFAGSDVKRITWVVPLVTITILLLLSWLRHLPLWCLACSFLAGIWLLGNIMMMVSASFSGGGFSQGKAWEVVIVLLLGLIPIYTFILATYGGSLGALLIVTLILICLIAFSAALSDYRKRQQPGAQNQTNA